MRDVLKIGMGVKYHVVFDHHGRPQGRREGLTVVGGQIQNLPSEKSHVSDTLIPHRAAFSRLLSAASIKYLPDHSLPRGGGG